MKNVLIASCALALFACVSTASAVEPISKSTLGNMGLGSMQLMSDNDGLAIRGKGTFAGVWGSSTASWNGQTSTNNYEAGAQWVGKSSFAKGQSYSKASNFESLFLQDPTGSSLSISSIGGMASGSAKAFAK